MENLENELFNTKWTRTYGDDSDCKRGYKEALNFSIRKREEGWMLGNFKADYEKTLEEIKGMHGPYIDGLKAGLMFNINDLEKQEVVTNE